MSKKEKLLHKFLNKPSSISSKAIELLLLEYNFIKINAKGSHVKYKHSIFTDDIVVPVHNNDCKEFYKNKIAKYLKHLIIYYENK